MTINAWIQGVALASLAAGVVLMLSPKRMQSSLRWCAAVCVLAALWTPLIAFIRTPATLPQELPGLSGTAFNSAGAAEWTVSRMGRNIAGLEEASFFCALDDRGNPTLITVALPTQPTPAQEAAANTLAGAVRSLYRLEKPPLVAFEVAVG